VLGASILGGERMVAYVADYGLLGSGEDPPPDLQRGRALIDRLDVADLESEADHGYQLFSATQRQNLLARFGARLDGGRSERTTERFQLILAAGGALLLRVAADSETTLTVRIADHTELLRIPPSVWHEVELELPPQLRSGTTPISIQSGAGSFTSLHYFSLAAPK
jgi:hypothetical protein